MSTSQTKTSFFVILVYHSLLISEVVKSRREKQRAAMVIRLGLGRLDAGGFGNQRSVDKSQQTTA